MSGARSQWKMSRANDARSVWQVYKCQISESAKTARHWEQMAISFLHHACFNAFRARGRWWKEGGSAGKLPRQWCRRHAERWHISAMRPREMADVPDGVCTDTLPDLFINESSYTLSLCSMLQGRGGFFKFIFMFPIFLDSYYNLILHQFLSIYFLECCLLP